MHYGGVVGTLTAGMGAGVIAKLPNTGGARSAILVIAMLSMAVGLIVLASTAVRYLAKRRASN